LFSFFAAWFAELLTMVACLSDLSTFFPLLAMVVVAALAVVLPSVAFLEGEDFGEDDVFRGGGERLSDFWA
jgi:hypothetical protein